MNRNKFLFTSIRIFFAVLTCPALVYADPLATQSGVAAIELDVSSNGRFLVRSDGTPFFWLADSAQTLCYRLSREDTDFYLENRAGLGFTVIETNIISFLGKNVANYYGHTPFIDGDPASPNEPFWQHVDYVINNAASLGLYIALVPDRSLIVDNFNFSSNLSSWSPGPLDINAAFSYGEYIGRRYSGKPIVWLLGWDVQPIGRESVFEALANGIAQGAASGDHSKVLITFHPGPTSATTRSSSVWFHNRSWLDFNSIQSGHMDNNEAYGLPENHAIVSGDYDQTPVKPTIDMEPAYENTPDGIWDGNGWSGPRLGADTIRRKAYWATFAGAFGHTYGHNDIVAFHEPGRPDYSGQQYYWKDRLNAPGASHMRHLRTLLESRSQVIRVPDQSVLSSPAGSGLSHIRASRASDGSYAFVYIPDGREVTINMSKISGDAVKASWFDPRSGAITSIGQFANSGTRDFDAPGATQNGNDWVLILDSVQSTPPPPPPTLVGPPR
jgi:hypothetical protein